MRGFKRGSADEPEERGSCVMDLRQTMSQSVSGKTAEDHVAQFDNVIDEIAPRVRPLVRSEIPPFCPSPPQEPRPRIHPACTQA